MTEKTYTEADIRKAAKELNPIVGDFGEALVTILNRQPVTFAKGEVVFGRASREYFQIFGTDRPGAARKLTTREAGAEMLLDCVEWAENEFRELEHGDQARHCRVVKEAWKRERGEE